MIKDLHKRIQKPTIVKEFQDFIARGNVIDMSVGIIMGAAFTTIVKSLVDDVFMPLIGVATKGVNFSTLFISLSAHQYETLAEAKAAGAATINYGLFINATINFLIVAAVVFFIVKAVNKLKRKQEENPAAAPPPPEDVQLLREIRDLLAKK